jgi:hypothetical protein
VVARLTRGEEVLAESGLLYAGERSTFAGRLPLGSAGSADLVVLAMDAETGNFGQFRRRLAIGAAGE